MADKAKRNDDTGYDEDVNRNEDTGYVEDTPDEDLGSEDSF